MVRLEHLLPWAERDRGLATDCCCCCGCSCAGAGAGAVGAAMLTPTLEAPLAAFRPARLHPQCRRHNFLVPHCGQGRLTVAGLLPSLLSAHL